MPAVVSAVVLLSTYQVSGGKLNWGEVLSFTLFPYSFFIFIHISDRVAISVSATAVTGIMEPARFDVFARHTTH